MKISIAVMLVLAGALAAMPPLAAAATPAPAAAKSAPAKTYTDAQLDQMLAPIALYPDQLLSQILMASTYPLEVVEAARWVRNPDNAALTGDALANALKSEPWAPSVKSLVPFPQVLHMLDENLTWTEQLGDAFLSSEKAVMASVQRLRKQAQEAGHLKSNQYADVEDQNSQIVIVPAMPDYVYVPVYDPFFAYGAWMYPAYPPYYFPGYFNVGIVGGFGWFGFSIVQPLWGWSNLNWVASSVYVNPTRYNDLDMYGPRMRGDRWHHDPYHRHGVPYPSADLRERFYRPGGVGELGRFRGYPMAPAPNTPAGAAAGVYGGGAAGATRQRQFESQRREANQFHEREQPQFRGREQPRFGGRESGGQQRFQAPRPSPAFESFGRSAPELRMQSQRGFSSRRSMPGGGGYFRGGGEFRGGGLGGLGGEVRGGGGFGGRGRR